MKRYAQKGVPINLSEETIYVGIDVHKVAWDVTVRTEDVELSSARIPGTWECLEKILTSYRVAKGVKAVYEAGFSGFWLYVLALSEDHGVGRGVSRHASQSSSSGKR